MQGAAGDTSFLAGTYVFGALIAFTSVHASVLALRWRDPGRYRPVEAPAEHRASTAAGFPSSRFWAPSAPTSAWVAVVVLEGDARRSGHGLDARRVGGVRRLPARASGSPSGSALAARSSHPDRGRRVEVEFQTMLIPVNTAASDDRRPTARGGGAARRRAAGVARAARVHARSRSGRRWTWTSTTSSEAVERLRRAGRADRRAIRHPRPHDPPSHPRPGRVDPRRGQPARLAADPASRGGAPARRAAPGRLRPRRTAHRGRGPPAGHDRPSGAGAGMRRHILIVCTDSRIEPQLVTDALARGARTVPRDEITVVRVLLPAVLPPTLPVSAWPPRLADRLERLRASVDERGRGSTPLARVEIVPCRSVPALLNAAWPVDALVLVGRRGWGVRRAARGVAPDVAIVPSRRARRRRQPTPSSRPEAWRSRR